MKFNLKYIVFIFCFILIVLLTIPLFTSQLSTLSLEEITSTRKLKNDIINNLKVNNLDTIYDKNTNTYYVSDSLIANDKNYHLNLNLDYGYKYKILDFSKNDVVIDYFNPIEVIIFNNKYYWQTKIQISNLPLIEINSNLEISNVETKSTFKYISNLSNDITISSTIKFRGATTQLFNKKSYRVNFYNNKYTKENNVEISDFYDGSTLILDAVYRDPSKIRNLLAIQIWNDISNDFDNIDVYSEFVEVFINNEYKGLYVLTEPINRKKLNLSKSSIDDTSILIKSSDYDMDESKYNNNYYYATENVYRHFEMKYPNNKDLINRSWIKFFDMIKDYYNESLPYSYEIINNTFDMTNFIDLVVFNAFTNNVDNNLAKNNYYYLENLEANKVYIQPWDMEYSFGMNWSNTDEKYIFIDLNDYKYIKPTFLFENTDRGTPSVKKIDELSIKRYLDIRKEFLTDEYIDYYLNSYLDALTKGAASRDANLWYSYDIEKEINDVKTWLHNRLIFFDEFVESYNEK